MSGLKEKIIEANGGIERGAQSRFAAKIHASRVSVSEWIKGTRMPGELMLERIARELRISVEELLSLLPGGATAPPPAAPGAAPGVVSDSGRGGYAALPGILVSQIPIVGQVSAARCDYTPDETPDGYLSVTVITPHVNRLRALVVSGNCMEPTAHDGEHILVQDPEGAKDGDLLVIEVEGQIMLKRLKIGKNGIAEYVADNKCCKLAKFNAAKVRVLAKVYRIISMRKP